MPHTGSKAGASYTNPVYDRPFPDPFVLKHRGVYFAYCTGVSDDGRVFGRMRSNDLVSWHPMGGAMKRLTEPHPHYWAPEVTYYNGKFYLYYSVGNETLMEIRCAVANEPDGDFSDMGVRLTNEDFAIDPHVVLDERGNWHMFYATDFLDHSHIGTGTVVDRMLDPFTLAKQPSPVTRARYDWQVYDPARKEKGGVRWHTVEGPFVLSRKGLFYQMFSGGNWQNETYGVSYAVSNSLESDAEWEQYSDGDTTLPVLRTIPGRILGPGHNSVVRGPNNRESYCIYHRWSGSERVLAIDRMDFSGPGRLFVNGPKDTPQLFPWLPARLIFSGDGQDGHWRVLSGEWESADSKIISTGTGEVLHEISRGTDYRCQIWIRSAETVGTFGIRLKSIDVDVFSFFIEPESGSGYTEWPASGGPRIFKLPAHFDATASHELTLDLDGEMVTVAVDGGPVVSANLPVKPSALSMFSTDSRVEFGPVDITFGFEELFVAGDMVKRGWDHYANRGTISMSNGVLTMEGMGSDDAVIVRNVERGNYEFCVNLRFSNVSGDAGRCTFGCGNIFTISVSAESQFDSEGNTFRLPANFNPYEFNQFRILSIDGRVDAFLGPVNFGSVSATDGEFIRFTVQEATVEIDMIRYTVL